MMCLEIRAVPTRLSGGGYYDTWSSQAYGTKKEAVAKGGSGIRRVENGQEHEVLLDRRCEVFCFQGEVATPNL